MHSLPSIQESFHIVLILVLHQALLLCVCMDGFSFAYTTGKMKDRKKMEKYDAYEILQPFENWSEINLMSVRFVWFFYDCKIGIEALLKHVPTIAIQQQKQQLMIETRRKNQL